MGVIHQESRVYISVYHVWHVSTRHRLSSKRPQAAELSDGMHRQELGGADPAWPWPSLTHPRAPGLPPFRRWLGWVWGVQPPTEPEDMRELSLTQIRAIHVVGP